MVQVDGLYKVQTGAYSVKANAEAQVNKLKEAGFDAFVTTNFGSAVSGGTPLKSVSEIAREVLAGNWGNGEDRKNRLTSAGYDYSSVQAAVNKLV
jgi:hypothetical protein